MNMTAYQAPSAMLSVAIAAALASCCSSEAMNIEVENTKRLAMVDQALATQDPEIRARLLIDAMDFTCPISIEGPNPDRLADREAVTALANMGPSVLPTVRGRFPSASRDQRINLGLVLIRLKEESSFDFLFDAFRKQVESGSDGQWELAVIVSYFEVPKAGLRDNAVESMKHLAQWRSNSGRELIWDESKGQFRAKHP